MGCKDNGSLQPFSFGADMGQDASRYLRSDAWPVGTELRLLNVPWDESYRDVVAWESAASRDAWFEAQQGETYLSNKFNYLWPNRPIAVPVPYSSAYRYNYVAVTNPSQPVDNEGPVRTYYYFITAVDYLSPQASNLTVQLDVMTTYGPTVELGRAFVERGHIAMANESCVDTNRYEYLTVPEGIDVGAEYLPVSRKYFDFMGEDDSEGAWVVVASTASLTTDPGTVSKPNLDTADGGWFDKFVNGCSLYAFPANRLTQFMSQLSGKSWVAQCVIDLYLVPGAFIKSATNPVKLFGTGIEMYSNVLTPDMATGGETVATLTYTDEDMTPKQYGDAPDKLYCYPYSVIEITSLNGNPVFLKPEFLGQTTQFRVFGTASEPTPRFCVYPESYQVNVFSDSALYEVSAINGGKTSIFVPGGSGLDNALWFENFPHISIVNNNYQLYLASNANRLSYQYQSAGWQLDRANMSAGVGYENAQQMTDLALEQANRMNQTQMENIDRSTLGGMLGGVAQTTVGMLEKSPAGAVGGLVNVLNTGLQAQSQGALQSTILANAWGSYGAQSEVNDRNLGLARAAAQGDYQNRIAGIDATVQDAALKAPSVVGQATGEVALWANSMIGMMVTFKTIGGAQRRAVVDYFRRYGYAIHRWLPMGSVRHLLCMSRFAYWKVQESTVTAAAANESERHTIRGVFEKGVTLWDAPESIGTTDLADNQPRPGYSY